MTATDSVPPPSKGATVPLGLGEVLAGRYRVEKLIGAGGMGVVVLAKDLEHGQAPVAIKLMREEALKDAEARARFAREAKAVVRLQSPHVARVLDVGTLDDGAPYLVIEYLEGRDLGSVLNDVGRVPSAEGVSYLLQICEGMAEAHGAGIIHRDLKPRNIFVTTDPSGAPLMKILDFGISKIVPVDGGTVDLSLTKTTDVMGSPSYMAPEQLKSARDADERSDIWSLGVMLYEVVTGRLPWEARSLTELGAMVLRDPLVPMATHCPEISPELDAVVARCLEKDPKQRYASVEELAHALEPLAHGLGSGTARRISSSIVPLARGRVSTTNRSRRTDPDPPKAKPSRAPWIAAAIIALVVIAGAGSLLAIRASKTTSLPPVVNEDRVPVKALPAPSAALPAPLPPAATPPAPPATGTASVAPPIAAIPHRARVAPMSAPVVLTATATATQASELPAPTQAPPPNPHDMSTVPRK